MYNEPMEIVSNVRKFFKSRELRDLVIIDQQIRSGFIPEAFTDSSNPTQQEHLTGISTEPSGVQSNSATSLTADIPQTITEIKSKI